MEKFNRAVRRHHAARLKKARSGYWGYAYNGRGPMSERTVGLLLNTPKPCSCWMCNRPRKVFGKSLKEIAEAEFLKALKDTDN